MGFTMFGWRETSRGRMWRKEKKNEEKRDEEEEEEAMGIVVHFS